MVMPALIGGFGNWDLIIQNTPDCRLGHGDLGVIYVMIEDLDDNNHVMIEDSDGKTRY